MSCALVKVNRLLESLELLRKVVGRSEEIFQFVEVGENHLAAWDGCLRVFLDFDVDLPAFSIPLTPFYSFAKMCDEDLEVCISDSLSIRCGELQAIAGDDKRRIPVENVGERLGEVNDFIVGLDFVSKSIDEGDVVEVHIGKTPVAHAVTSNLSVFYVFDGAGRRFSFSSPYQSTRRLVKSMKGISGWELFHGRSLGFKSGNVKGFLCGEKLEEPIAIPKISTVERLDEDFKRILGKGADFLGNSEASLTLRDGRVTILGKRKDMTLLMSGELDTNVNFSVNVPLRKFRSYVSSMSSIWVSKGNGIVRFLDGRKKRYVIIREIL